MTFCIPVGLLIEFVEMSEKFSRLSEKLSNYLEVYSANLGFYDECQ